MKSRAILVVEIVALVDRHQLHHRALGQVDWLVKDEPTRFYGRSQRVGHGQQDSTRFVPRAARGEGDFVLRSLRISQEILRRLRQKVARGSRRFRAWRPVGTTRNEQFAGRSSGLRA